MDYIDLAYIIWHNNCILFGRDEYTAIIIVSPKYVIVGLRVLVSN